MAEDAGAASVPALSLDAVGDTPTPKVATPRDLRPSTSDLNNASREGQLDDAGEPAGEKKVRRKRRVPRASKEQAGSISEPADQTNGLGPEAEAGSAQRQSAAGEPLADPSPPVLAAKPRRRVSRASKEQSDGQAAPTGEQVQSPELDGSSQAAESNAQPDGVPKERRRRRTREASKKESFSVPVEPSPEPSPPAEGTPEQPATVSAPAAASASGEATAGSLQGGPDASQDVESVEIPLQSRKSQELPAAAPEVDDGPKVSAELGQADASATPASADSVEAGQQSRTAQLSSVGESEQQEEPAAKSTAAGLDQQPLPKSSEQPTQESTQIQGDTVQQPPQDLQQGAAPADEPAPQHTEPAEDDAARLHPPANPRISTIESAWQRVVQQGRGDADSRAVHAAATDHAPSKLNVAIPNSDAEPKHQPSTLSPLAQALAYRVVSGTKESLAASANSAAVVRGAAMHAKTRRVSDSDMKKKKKRPSVAAPLVPGAALGSGTAAPKPGVGSRQGGVRAALEEHGFKHVAEQLEQKAQEATKEASPEEQVPAVDQAPQKAPPQAPADESMEDSERAAVAPDSDTGEGLEHLHAFNPAQRVVRAGAKSQVYVVGADDISPDASGELADEGNYGQDARSRKDHFVEPEPETEADIMERSLRERIIGLQAITDSEEELEPPDAMEKWSMSQRISELESQVMLLKLERDRTAAALNKRFGPSIPVHKLIQALQMELGISQGNGILPASPSKSPNSTIKAVTAKSGDTVGEQSVRTVSTPFKPKMSQQQRKHLEAIRTVKRQEAERTQAELGEAMMALSILMAECKGNAARRANLEKQNRSLKSQVALLLRKCDNDDQLITGLRGSLPADTQAALLAGREMAGSQDLQSPQLSTNFSEAVAASSTPPPRRWVR